LIVLVITNFFICLYMWNTSNIDRNVIVELLFSAVSMLFDETFARLAY
jgi:hypothetical protein